MEKKSALTKEIKRFLRHLCYIKIGKRNIAIHKDVPCLFEISPRKDSISSRFVKDFSLLKRFGYIPVKKIPRKPLIPTSALSLHITHDCNMACEYCFAKKGMNAGKVKYMPPKIAAKAVKFFYKHAGQKNATIIFIGGEPLLNLPAIEAAAKESRKFKKFNTKLLIVTNGTLLNKKTAEFLKRNNIKIVISYDGIQKEHDRKRIMKNGSKSSGSVIDNIRLLKNLGIEPEVIKTTIPRDTNYSFTDFMESFTKIGVHPHKICAQYQYSLPVKPLEKRLVLNKLAFYDKIISDLHKGIPLEKIPLNGNISKFHNFIYPSQKFYGGCGFSENKILVTPDGSFYFCDLLVNQDKFYVGNLEKGIFKKRLKNLHNKFRIKTHLCKNCWVNSFCDYHCLFVHINKKVMLNKCAITKAESKKIIEIFLALGIKDILSVYTAAAIPNDLETLLNKLIIVSYGIQSILKEKTSAIKPLNIIPFHKYA